MIRKAELASIPAFEGFDDRALSAVGAMMRVFEVEEGGTILEQGARTGGAYVVLDGEVRVVREASNRRSVDVRSLLPGTLFGLLSCLDGGPRGASIVARSRVRIAEIPREAVTELLEGRTHVALRFQVAVCRTLFHEVRATNRLLAELAAIPDSELATYELEPVPVPRSYAELDDLSEDLEPL
jgi:CRP-like cAMP-binding protein